MPDTGSAYGGKHTGETAIEAARLARAAKRPVKLVWTREEEFSWAYFRPAGVIEVEGGVRIRRYASRHGNFTTTIPDRAGIRSTTIFPTSVLSFIRRILPCAKDPTARSPPPPTTSPANPTWTNWRILKMDPLEFRMKNLKNERLRAVFEAAAKKFGWGEAKTRLAVDLAWAADSKSWQHRDLCRSQCRSQVGEVNVFAWFRPSSAAPSSTRTIFAIRLKDRTSRDWAEHSSKPSSSRMARFSTAGCHNIGFRDSVTFLRWTPSCLTAKIFRQQARVSAP